MTLTSTYNTKQAAQKCVLKTKNRDLCAIKIQITQNQVTSFTLLFCTETFTSAPPLGCTANYGNRSTALVYILTTRRVPWYPVSYPVGYPGNELPGNGSPNREPRNNGLTDRDAVVGWTRVSHMYYLGSGFPIRRGNFEGESGGPS